MELIAIVTVLALLEYFFFAFMVGQQRGKLGVEAPAISGDPLFERYFRVHQNTLEQLMMFLPGLWLFGRYASPTIGGLLGLLFIVARALYFRGYVSDPPKRVPGVVLGTLVNLVLLLGGLIGAIYAWF